MTDAKMGTLGASGIGRSWRAISAVQLWKLRSWIWQPRKKIVNPQRSYERRQSELRTAARGRTLRKPRVRWYKDEIHMENDVEMVLRGLGFDGEVCWGVLVSTVTAMDARSSVREAGAPYAHCDWDPRDASHRWQKREPGRPRDGGGAAVSRR